MKRQNVVRRHVRRQNRSVRQTVAEKEAAKEPGIVEIQDGRGRRTHAAATAKRQVRPSSRTKILR